MIKFILLFWLCTFYTFTHAQTSKQIDKALKIYQKSSSKGKAKLIKYIEKAPDFGNNRGWETLIKMEYKQYIQLKEMFEEMTLEVENTDSDDSTNAATASTLKNDFLKRNKQRFVNVCRKAAVMSTSSLADYYLRKMMIDYEPDTLISSKAKAYFDEGESFFIKKDFELARLNYHKAVSTDNDYYKAILYLGDTFWRENNFDSAIYYFSMAKEIKPDLLEPRKYLIDAFMGKKLLVRAKKECLEAFCVYPGYSIKYRYMNILKQENKWLYTRNIKRDFFPNNMSDSTQKKLLSPYHSYRNAKLKIANYCDENGILKENDITDDSYLEVYSWRSFLSENEDELPEVFRFAQKMNQENYLDCYIFFSFFHADIYPQYKHFMSSEANQKKMKYFIEKYLIDEY